MNVLVRVSHKLIDTMNSVEDDRELTKEQLLAFYRGMYATLKNGIPIPEGHGKLVDVNSIPQEDRNIIVKSLLRPGTIAYVGSITLQDYISGLPTIIEADEPGDKALG